MKGRVLPQLFQKVGMAAGTGRRQDQIPVVDGVDQKPIRNPI